MFGPKFALTVAGAALAAALACSKPPASPAAPTAVASGDAHATDAVTLKATAPTPLSPVNDAVQTEAPTLTASGASLKYQTGVVLQYRFQVINEAGTIVQDSNPISALSFKVTATLEFKKRYTWRVRAEYQDQGGPWSASGSFIFA